MRTPANGGGKQADRGEHREASAHAGRHHQIAEAFVVHDLAQRTGVGVGGDDDVLRVVDGAELAQQQIADDQELRHRLGRFAGLADHIERGASEVEAVEQLAEGPGVDVVGDDDARASVRRRRGAPWCRVPTRRCRAPPACRTRRALPPPVPSSPPAHPFERADRRRAARRRRASPAGHVRPLPHVPPTRPPRPAPTPAWPMASAIMPFTSSRTLIASRAARRR